ncbi:hypothetical protein H0H93_009785, partial [Arthromyces matolae]
MKDSNGNIVFDTALWQKAKNILKNIDNGLYSNSPNVQYYILRGYDRDGLATYTCGRGTNHVEGGVHQNIVCRFGSYNAAPRFAVNLIRDYCLHHNLKVGTFNRTGQQYTGSYDVWTLNRLVRLRDQTRDNFLPDSRPASWVNSNDYEQSSESFGILPLSVVTQTQLGMLEFQQDYAVKEKIRHLRLAYLQKTRVAILPVHTSQERALFTLLIQEKTGMFTSETQPNWIALACTWSQHCDGKTIFYKLPEHLKTYYKAWVELRHEKNAIEQNRTAYNELRSYLIPDPSSIPSIPVAARVSIADSLDKSKATHAASDSDVNEAKKATSLAERPAPADLVIVQSVQAAG